MLAYARQKNSRKEFLFDDRKGHFEFYFGHEVDWHDQQSDLNDLTVEICKLVNDPREYEFTAPSGNTYLIGVPKLNRCEYHPRIYRPIDNYNCESHDEPPHDPIALWSSIVQLETLCDRLERIFQIVTPDKSNLEVYGHEMKNIIILACTELEAQCKGLLRANSYTFKSNRSNTNDYFSICEPLRLREYSVSFTAYPELKVCTPFKNWAKSAPTTSLEWYDVYNSIKHDREMNFKLASLWRAIESVAACAIMITAQYGVYKLHQRPTAARLVNFDWVPQWSPSEHYHAPLKAVEGWLSVDAQF